MCHRTVHSGTPYAKHNRAGLETKLYHEQGASCTEMGAVRQLVATSGQQLQVAVCVLKPIA